MSDINAKILKAMQENLENEQVPEDQGNMFKLVKASFKGTFRYTVIVVIVFQTLFAGLSAYCGYQMLNIEAISGKIEWATGAIAAFIVFALLRLWFFLELNRLSVLREIKRVELQVALLASRLQ